MASFKIHQDQENRVPDLRQKQVSKAMAAQQKRSVLGQINENAAPCVKNKQTLKPQDTCKENSRKNQGNRKNLVAPVVPVAQFEAFKVYEDDEYMSKIDQKLRNISKSNVYKGTSEDKFVTKAELPEEEQRRIVERIKLLEDFWPADEPKIDEEPASPMSVEKSMDENSEQLAREVILKKPSLQNRDLFFEMEEYREDIYAYLREHELRNRAKPGYIGKQPDVTENMRAILVDWLVEVVEEYRMQTETLYLAVNFIDRFLSYMSVVKAKLQLVGTAAMFIAAKYEEIFPPDVKEFVYITDDTYDKTQVIRMEHLILRVLGFDLSVPTPLTFINAICVSAKLPEKTQFLAMYLSELALLEVGPYLQFLPSTIAASAVALARHTLNQEPWNDVLYKSTGYSLIQLEKCVLFLYELFVKAPKNPQHAIQEKYKSSKYLHVAKISLNTDMIHFE